MKRKKAATLLLTLGLAVAGNGMTAFAAEESAEAPVPEAQREVSDEEKQEAEAETENADAEPRNDVNRIVSFTDYTGMRVTYDANVSQRYIYEVEDGILKAVRWKQDETDNGETQDIVVFEGNVELRQPEEGEMFRSIAPDVFAGNRLITYVKLPAGMNAIAEGSFKGCTALKSVHLPSTVGEIGEGAFENCSAMTQISIPKAVRAIGDNAFKGDAKLQEVQIRDVADSELTSVGAHAFAGCRSLQQITLPQAVAEADEGVFDSGTTVMMEEETH